MFEQSFSCIEHIPLGSEVNILTVFETAAIYHSNWISNSLTLLDPTHSLKILNDINISDFKFLGLDKINISTMLCAYPEQINSFDLSSNPFEFRLLVEEYPLTIEHMSASDILLLFKEHAGSLIDCLSKGNLLTNEKIRSTINSVGDKFCNYSFGPGNSITLKV